VTSYLVSEYPVIVTYILLHTISKILYSTVRQIFDVDMGCLPLALSFGVNP